VTIESVNAGWVSVRVEAGGERGCLKRSELEPTPAIDRAADARRAREIGYARGASAPPLPSPTGRPLRFAAFATAGWFTATANQSFDAVLDTHSGTDIGFGAQVAWQTGALRGLFVEFDASRFEETGERAFVHEGEVFPLGIPLTIGLKPIEVSAGYRLNPVRRTRTGVVASPVAWFAGGGVGSVGYTETDDESEISDRFVAYHVMGGADVTLWRYLQIGAEARVPMGTGWPRRRRHLRRVQRDRPWRLDLPRPCRRRFLGGRALRRARWSPARRSPGAWSRFVRSIPSGRVATYGDVAVLAGRPARPAPSAT
jgi:hypothetical protein